MKIQKHSLFQVDVPFSPVSTSDDFIASRYIIFNCFMIDNINYINFSIEEIYDPKSNPSQYKLIRVIDNFQFEERELNGTLHMLLNAICKNEISGNSEIVFALSLFSEIIFDPQRIEIREKLQSYFPRWNIEQFIHELKTPETISKLMNTK